jgi:hypothetical protein
MCLRSKSNIVPERRAQNFAGHHWQNEPQQQNRNLNIPRNLFEHLPKVIILIKIVSFLI